MSQVPETITLWICPVCGRKEWSKVGWGKGVRHRSQGERCLGVPEMVEYQRRRHRLMVTREVGLVLRVPAGERQEVHELVLRLVGSDDVVHWRQEAQTERAYIALCLSVEFREAAREELEPLLRELGRWAVTDRSQTSVAEPENRPGAGGSR